MVFIQLKWNWDKKQNDNEMKWQQIKNVITMITKENEKKVIFGIWPMIYTEKGNEIIKRKMNMNDMKINDKKVNMNDIEIKMKRWWKRCVYFHTYQVTDIPSRQGN